MIAFKYPYSAKSCGRIVNSIAPKIATSFDTMAEMILLKLNRMGVRVPEDISLLGFGGTWRQTPTMQELTSVAVDEVEIGRRAVELLSEMRQGVRPLDDEEEIVMPLSLTDGRTLGPA